MGNTWSQTSAQDRAILEVKVQRDKLRRHSKKFLELSRLEHKQALDFLKVQDKRRALIALRRKKYQEQLLSKTDKQLDALEQLINTIEFSQIQKDVIYGLRQGNEVLKEIQKEFSIDAVEKLMDETADGIAYQEEVSEMLASRITNQDEEEIEEELAALEYEALKSIPQIPQNKLPERQPEIGKTTAQDLDELPVEDEGLIAA